MNAGNWFFEFEEPANILPEAMEIEIVEALELAQEAKCCLRWQRGEKTKQANQCLTGIIVRLEHALQIGDDER